MFCGRPNSLLVPTLSRFARPDGPALRWASRECKRSEVTT